MIEYKKGDLLHEDVEALVNTVNCVGIMGRGLALQFKKSFPENFKAYAAGCERNEGQPERMFIFKAGQLTNSKSIINFPRKRQLREKSRIEDVDSGTGSVSTSRILRFRQSKGATGFSDCSPLVILVHGGNASPRRAIPCQDRKQFYRT